MKKQLDFETSKAIVGDTLREVCRPAHVAGDIEAGEILATPELQQLFRARLSSKVKSLGFGIETSSIPLGPNVTLDHVAHSLATLAGDLGGLAGDTGTDDP